MKLSESKRTANINGLSNSSRVKSIILLDQKVNIDVNNARFIEVCGR